MQRNRLQKFALKKSAKVVCYATNVTRFSEPFEIVPALEIVALALERSSQTYLLHYYLILTQSAKDFLTRFRYTCWRSLHLQCEWSRTSYR